MSRSIMRASTHPTRLWESRTSHQSSIVGTAPTGAAALGTGVTGAGTAGTGFAGGAVVEAGFLSCSFLSLPALLPPGAAECDGGAAVPDFSAVPRFNSDNFSPAEI